MQKSPTAPFPAILCRTWEEAAVARTTLRGSLASSPKEETAQRQSDLPFPLQKNSGSSGLFPPASSRQPFRAASADPLDQQENGQD